MAYLRDNYANEGPAGVAKHLERSEKSVRRTAYYAGVAQGSGETQKCWSCRWATNPAGNPCPWSSRFKPVKGWNAELVLMKPSTDWQREHNYVIKSYRIRGCPLFKEG